MGYPKTAAALRRFEAILADLPETDREPLRAAFRLAERLHREQLKFGLYPYIVHPLSVFSFLAGDLGLRDPDLLAAALLHDTVEDCGLKPESIGRRFGDGVRKIVEAVTRIPPPAETEAEKKRAKMRFFREVVCRGGRSVVLLGIADKYDNIRRAPLIPRTSPHRPKWRRWALEAEAFLDLAGKTDFEAYVRLANAITTLRRKIHDDER